MFAEKNYKNVCYINFKSEPLMKRAFSGNLDVANLLINISSLRPQLKFIDHETVLIFDEIQECSSARSSIKQFVEDGRYDVIASGSLLGIKGYNKKYGGGSPVGFEHTSYMLPMDFEEFLWAINVSLPLIENLKKCLETLTPFSESVHQAFQRYFREYICVGGMPSVVSIFVKTNDLNQVYREQKDILEGFKDDYGKHLNSNEEEITDRHMLSKINLVFDSIPSQLAKENKKFFYSQIEKKDHQKYLTLLLNG